MVTLHDLSRMNGHSGRLAKLAKARAFVPNKLGDETKSFSSHGAESTDVTSSSDVTGDQVGS